MNYRRYKPIDPREAFTVTAKDDSDEGQSIAASQAARSRRTVDGIGQAVISMRRCRRIGLTWMYTIQASRGPAAIPGINVAKTPNYSRHGSRIRV